MNNSRSVLLLCWTAVVLATDICDKTCCSPNWLYNNSFCYRYYSVRKTWQNARHYCVSLGADLASIRSADENSIVSMLTSGVELRNINPCLPKGTTPTVPRIFFLFVRPTKTRNPYLTRRVVATPDVLFFCRHF